MQTNERDDSSHGRAEYVTTVSELSDSVSVLGEVVAASEYLTLERVHPPETHNLLAEWEQHGLTSEHGSLAGRDTQLVHSEERWIVVPHKQRCLVFVGCLVVFEDANGVSTAVSVDVSWAPHRSFERLRHRHNRLSDLVRGSDRWRVSRINLWSSNRFEADEQHYGTAEAVNWERVERPSFDADVEAALLRALDALQSPPEPHISPRPIALSARSIRGNPHYTDHTIDVVVVRAVFAEEDKTNIAVELQLRDVNIGGLATPRSVAAKLLRANASGAERFQVTVAMIVTSEQTTSFLNGGDVQGVPLMSLSSADWPAPLQLKGDIALQDLSWARAFYPGWRVSSRGL